MLSMDEIKTQVSEHAETLLALKKHLRVLEVQQASKGIDTEATIVTEIDEYRAKISDLELKITWFLEGELQPRMSEYDAFESMLSVVESDEASIRIFQGVVGALSYHSILTTPFDISEKRYVLQQMRINVENECRIHMARLGSEIEELNLLLPE